MQKNKKQIIILSVLALGIAAVLYFGMFRKSPPPAASQAAITVPVAGQTSPAAGAFGAAGQTSPGSASSPAGSNCSGAFLSCGSGLNFGVLKSDYFQSLFPPSYPKVSPKDVGNPNPFGM